MAALDPAPVPAKIAIMAKNKHAAPTTDGTTGENPTADPGAPPSLAAGAGLIREQLRTLPAGPGVYRMLDRKGDALYVGKAKSLKKRVASYTNPAKLSNRLGRMVAETRALEIVTTHTEVEALLLESNLIKRLAPRYNVLLRDDKSFPYIFITGDHDWPQLTKYRGARTRKGSYFGPFASAGAVNQTLAALQRAFLLRSCSNSVFAGRQRPCLLYQIKRCCAPCVDRIDAEAYASLVKQAKAFLAGRNPDIQRQLAKRMDEASAALDYEKAALFRDRIQALTQIQARQDINIATLDEADVIAAHQAAGQTCIQVFFFRGGRNYGNRAYFPRHDRALDTAEVLSAFLGQFYDNKTPPELVLLSHSPREAALMADALAVRAGHRVEVIRPQRGTKRKLVEHALSNARETLARRLSESASQRRLLDGVAALFGLDGAPDRIEVYDNSHLSGTHPVGAMIVHGPEGLVKAAYRKFNIKGGGGPAGDDYAMLREVLTRRFTRALKEDPAREDGAWPDLVLIDGGAGQLGVAQQVMADLGIEDLALVAMAKGPDRDAGRETFYRPGHDPLTLAAGDPVLYFLQRLRDEAHRFVIGAHRGRRSRALVRSVLDDIPGVGARRKRALLNHFGSAREVARAGLADLEAVDGINRSVAKIIYDQFHA